MTYYLFAYSGIEGPHERVTTIDLTPDQNDDLLPRSINQDLDDMLDVKLYLHRMPYRPPDVELHARHFTYNKNPLRPIQAAWSPAL